MNKAFLFKSLADLSPIYSDMDTNICLKSRIGQNVTARSFGLRLHGAVLAARVNPFFVPLILFLFISILFRVNISISGVVPISSSRSIIVVIVVIGRRSIIVIGSTSVVATLRKMTKVKAQ